MSDGELVFQTADGQERRSASLVGAVFRVGERSLQIESVTSERDGARVIWLHRVRVVAADGSRSELCHADADGNRWALAVRDARGQVELVCSSGAIGKCIRWGYSPRVGREIHEACVRMVRADYGGDGATATRDGTIIAFCDRAGVHPCRGGEPIEAAWSPAGATCVRYTRFADLMSLSELGAKYPRLVGHLGDACSMERAGGAALFNWVPGR